ncbi:MAG TPA: response regulator [Nitrospirae bacterium]|nr:response regulator [Nitrospirota bacterium]
MTTALQIQLHNGVKKVIIIDDIKEILERANSYLDRSGIEVFPVPSNAEVLQKQREVKADLIISYLDMPDMSGEELCSAVRKNHLYAGVAIMMVCPNEKVLEERSKHCSADVFMSVPVSEEALLLKAHDLLKIPSRTSFRVPVNVSMSLESGDGKNFLGFSQDLSATGMLLGTSRVINLGDRLSCSFQLGETEQLNVKAEVVRLVSRKGKGAPYLYGLKFLDVSPALAVELECFVSEVPKEGGEG